MSPLLKMTAYQALRETAAWFDLSTRAKIRVTGEDAARLLHAMTTNNVKDLKPGQGLYAFFLTDKGRIQADANIFRIGDDFLLDTEPEIAAKVYQHLDKYIIADDAYVTDETTDWFEYAVEGPQSAAIINGPQNLLDIEVKDDTYIAKVPLGYRIWSRQPRQFDVPQASAEEARTVRLENGMPRYGEDLTERYLVQETQQLQAVHFSKGCYLGQEIVERVRSQGKVHRLLTPIRITGTIPPPPGTKLTANGSPAGELTSAAYSPALTEIVALAYLRSEVIDTRVPMSLETDQAITARIA